MPRCLPLLPICLIEDLQYMLSAVTPKCLCQVLPALVVNQEVCIDEQCDSATILYSSCPERDAGMLWTPVFVVRWLLPSVFQYFAQHAEGIDFVQDMLDDLENGVPLSSVDLTCAKLNLVTVLFVLLAAKLAVVAACAVMRPMIDSFITTTGTLTVTVPFLLTAIPQLIREQIATGELHTDGWAH